MSTSVGSRSPAPYRLLVFDWDGTLVDSEARIVQAAREAIDDLGLPDRSHEEIRGIIGLGLHEALRALYPDHDPALHDRFVAYYRRSFTRETPAPMFPGVAQTLIRLHCARYALAVATGKSRRGLDRELEHSGLGHLFGTTRCADEAPSKPHPLMLEQIIEEHGCGREETLMVGDTEFDLEMACNAGVAAVAVTCGAHDRERLLRFSPLVLLPSVAALPDWLERRANPA